MAGTQFNQIGFDEEENLLRFVCSETVESKLVKRYSDTSHNDEFSLVKVYTYTMPRYRTSWDNISPQITQVHNRQLCQERFAALVPCHVACV